MNTRAPITAARSAEALMDHFAAVGQANAFYQLVIVGEDRLVLVLVPDGREEVVEVAREQRGGVGGKAAREVRGADDRHPMLHHGLAGDRAFDIPAGARG